MSLDDLLRLWSIADNEGVREARDGHRDSAAELLDAGLDPLLPQGEAGAASRVRPDPRQDEPQT